MTSPSHSPSRTSGATRCRTRPASSGPTIALEQQADCFAGAWVRRIDEGTSNRLSLNEGNLDTGLAGFLDLP